MKNVNIEAPHIGRQRWMIVDDNQHVLALMRSVLARFTDADLQCFCSPHAAFPTFTAAPERLISSSPIWKCRA